MKFKLYPHQKTQLKTLEKELKENQHVIFGACTGWGKSVAIENIVKQEYLLGHTTLVLAPTIKLVNQLYNTLKHFNPKVYRGDDKRGHEQKYPKVIIAGLDTVSNRLSKNINEFGNISKLIMDECHISGNFTEATIKKSRMTLLYKRYWNSAIWIGFSATPMDEKWKRLQGWDKTIYETQTQDLIDKGYLSHYIYKGTTNELVSNENKVVKNGRYDMALASKDLTKPANLDRLIETTKLYNADKHKTLIFCATIEHAEQLHAKLENSEVVHSGKGVNATKLIEQFQNKKSGILINVDILTTGFDDPTVDLLILARPIRTIRLAIQVFGRGLRKHGDKVTTIVDLCGVYSDCGSPSEYRDYAEEGNKTVGDAIYRCCEECDGVALSGSWKYLRKLNKGDFIIEQTCPMCGFVKSQSVKDTNVPADVTIIDSKSIKKAEKKAKKAKKKEKKAIKKMSDFTGQEMVNILKDIIRKSPFLGWKEGRGYYIVKELIEMGEREFLQKEIKMYKLKMIKSSNLLAKLLDKIKGKK